MSWPSIVPIVTRLSFLPTTKINTALPLVSPKISLNKERKTQKRRVYSTDAATQPRPLKPPKTSKMSKHSRSYSVPTAPPHGHKIRIIEVSGSNIFGTPNNSPPPSPHSPHSPPKIHTSPAKSHSDGCLNKNKTLRLRKDSELKRIKLKLKLMEESIKREWEVEQGIEGKEESPLTEPRPGEKENPFETYEPKDEADWRGLRDCGIQTKASKAGFGGLVAALVKEESKGRPGSSEAGKEGKEKKD
jgi:hypothetical protein